MNSRVLFITAAILLVVLFCLDLTVGDASISFSDVIGALTGGDCPERERRIILHIRLIKSLASVLTGAALTVSGLQMQTLFRNPLAGPYVLGISSGASLGVAIFILAGPLIVLPSGLMQFGVAGAAWIGAAAILVVIAAVGRRLKDIMVVLILGLMFSSGVSAVVQILQYLSQDEALKSFVIWTMGSLGDITWTQMWIMLPAVIIGLILGIAVIKPLNLLLFGEEYASTMGLDIKRSRSLIFISTTLLAGTVTAFCGPIGFIGLALPHVTRMLFRKADHRILVPGCILIGAVTMTACDILSKLFLLPINAITALIGIPVVIVIVIRNSKI